MAELTRARLNPGGEVQRLDGSDRPRRCAQGQKFTRGAGVGPALVQVADVGREEFEEAPMRARPLRPEPEA
jgi:hypothetical protein